MRTSRRAEYDEHQHELLAGGYRRYAVVTERFRKLIWARSVADVRAWLGQEPVSMLARSPVQWFQPGDIVV